MSYIRPFLTIENIYLFLCCINPYFTLSRKYQFSDIIVNWPCMLLKNVGSLLSTLHSPFYSLCAVSSTHSVQSLLRTLRSPFYALCTVPSKHSVQSLLRTLHSPFIALCTVPSTHSVQSLLRTLNSPF